MGRENTPLPTDTTVHLDCRERNHFLTNMLHCPLLSHQSRQLTFLNQQMTLSSTTQGRENRLISIEELYYPLMSHRGESTLLLYQHAISSPAKPSGKDSTPLPTEEVVYCTVQKRQFSRIYGCLPWNCASRWDVLEA